MRVLGSSVTVAQEPLELYVQVRVLAPQFYGMGRDSKGAATPMGEPRRIGVATSSGAAGGDRNERSEWRRRVLAPQLYWVESEQRSDVYR